MTSRRETNSDTVTLLLLRVFRKKSSESRNIYELFISNYNRRVIRDDVKKVVSTGDTKTTNSRRGAEDRSDPW